VADGVQGMHTSIPGFIVTVLMAGQV